MPDTFLDVQRQIAVSSPFFDLQLCCKYQYASSHLYCICMYSVTLKNSLIVALQLSENFPSHCHTYNGRLLYLHRFLIYSFVVSVIKQLFVYISLAQITITLKNRLIVPLQLSKKFPSQCQTLFQTYNSRQLYLHRFWIYSFAASINMQHLICIVFACIVLH